MKTVKLFVEGGGDSNSLRTECRSAFSKFLEKAGLSGKMPRIIASGSRKAAYSDFCTAINNGEESVLLVDSEGTILNPPDNSGYDKNNLKTWKPWYHLKHRMEGGVASDDWDMPSGASENDCHLMVQVMESWFLADSNTVKKYYGQGFNENSIPARQDIESIPKKDVMDFLNQATRNSHKGKYSKSAHSFELLSIIDPHKVTDKSLWAKRFVDLLSEKMSGLRNRVCP